VQMDDAVPKGHLEPAVTRTPPKTMSRVPPKFRDLSAIAERAM
jgi:hypothetical protein